jgi:hypothetical protein
VLCLSVDNYRTPNSVIVREHSTVGHPEGLDQAITEGGRRLTVIQLPCILTYMRLEILLTQGQVAVVDECDHAELSRHNWYAQWSARSQTFYAARRIRDGGKRRVIYMHRQIMGSPEGFDIDHRDKNGLHNWRDNLRAATRAQNTQSARSTRNTSGFRGVRKTKDPRYKHKTFLTRIVFQNKSVFLGCFETAEQASEVYEAKAKELFGEFYLPPENRLR